MYDMTGQLFPMSEQTCSWSDICLNTQILLYNLLCTYLLVLSSDICIFCTGSFPAYLLSFIQWVCFVVWLWCGQWIWFVVWSVDVVSGCSLSCGQWVWWSVVVVWSVDLVCGVVSGCSLWCGQWVWWSVVVVVSGCSVVSGFGLWCSQWV